MNPTLQAALAMNIGELAALSPHALNSMQQQAAEALCKAKAAKEWIDGAIGQKYQDLAQSQRVTLGKDTGSVHFDDDGIRITADLPKRPAWDQKKLAEIAQRIRANGEDPTEFVEISYKVAERKYSAWSATIRDAFAPARTLKTGKQTFKLSVVEGGEA